MGIVALAEMGDKTQLLALLLAARFRQPWPVVLGIFTATIVNHALAGAVGVWVTQVLGEKALRRILGGSFIAMVIWMLIPDKLDEGDAPKSSHFVGDYVWVVAGTTLGMMLANAPVVWLGDKLVKRMPIKLLHGISAVIFPVLGVLMIVGI